MSNLVSTAGATKFRPGQRVVHPRFGRGRIVETYAVAQNPTEETEYRVKLIGDRYPATLAESNLTAL